MTTYTEEELKQAYQLGYSHGANGRPPLDGLQVSRAVGLGQPQNEPAEQRNQQG
jgi:hypothetical protein